ncbi:hypothetical protein LCGC14_2591380, partial [marine sediment metagenome]
ENGLCTIHGATVDPGAQTVTISTRLGHSSGQWVQQEITLPGTMKGGDDEHGNKTIRFDAQSVGSAITYARRYGWSAVTGIASEEDDDGNGASGKSGEQGGEKKSGNREPMKTCPDCGKQAVIKGQEQYGGGWVCWKKKGGCGKSWETDPTEVRDADGDSTQRGIYEAELIDWANGDLISPDEGKILHKKLNSNFNDEALKALHRETREKVIERQKVLENGGQDG